MVSVVMAGMGNTVGAVGVTVTGGLGVAPRTRTLVTSGTRIKPLEAMSVAYPCEKNAYGDSAGGLTHHTKNGSKKYRYRSVHSPLVPGASIAPGIGNVI